MNPRTTGIVALIAAVLGAFVYFYEIRGEEGRKEAEEAEKRLFAGLEADDVAIIGITTSDGQDAVLERGEDGWLLSAPITAEAEGAAADAMANALVTLASESVIEDPQAPDVYGLGDGAREVHFTAAGEARALRFGEKTPVGASSYAAASGSDAVYTVPTFRAQAFAKSLDDLREKRILRFDTGAVRRVEARWPGGGLALEKSGDDWRVVQPFEAPADPDTVRDLLSDLSYLRANGFVDDPPADAEAGLAEPAFEVVLRGEGDGNPLEARMAIGESLDGSSRLVRTGSPTLFRVAAERIDDFPRDAVAYRMRQLAKFPANHARRMEIVLRGGDDELVLEAIRGDSGWQAQPRDFAPGKLASLVSELSRLKARGVVADGMGEAELASLGLAPPNAVYRIYGADGESPEELLAEVHLGTLQGGEGIAARSASDPTVYRLEYELAEHLPVNREAFENRFAASEVPAEPEGFEEATRSPEPPPADDESP